MILRKLLFALALVVAACAQQPTSRVPPADHVILLPQHDGVTGAVLVQQGGAQATLDTPYTSARAGAAGGVEVAPVDPAEVRSRFSRVLEALPPAPTSITVYFVFAQDELTEESRREFAPVLQEFARRPAPEIIVIGHADQVGSERVNETLSMRRAERVRDMLVQRGIHPDRITAAGRGSREPAVRAPDGMQEPRNRRVEINVR